MSEFAARRCFFRAAYFNIWKGGEQAYPLARTADVVRRSLANVVAVHESEGATPRLAEMLGTQYDAEASLLSDYEILDRRILEDSDFTAILVRLPNARTVWAVKGYLREKLYGPYELRKGVTGFEVGKNEEVSGRLEAIRKALAWIDDIAAGQDVVLMAGLNSPSHLDWTERAADQNFGLAVAWPVTLELQAAGFIDAYRACHPDELRHPGHTWTPGYPAPKVKRNEKHDRIDFVFYRGDGLRLAGCQVVGEHGRTSDIVVRPWPSDHRVVVAELESV